MKTMNKAFDEFNKDFDSFQIMRDDCIHAVKNIRKTKLPDYDIADAVILRVIEYFKGENR